MKKNWLFFLSLSIFLALRLLAIGKKEALAPHSLEKPKLPPPITVTQVHPWLAKQPFIKGEVLEVVRDLEKIRHLSAQIPHLTEEELTALMMEKLLALQATIPFVFPETLYNVLCITEPPGESSFPYHILKRLYLGESDWGLPFYLDVRLYSLQDQSTAELKEWLVQTLEGSVEECALSNESKVFLCRGLRNQEMPDQAHGFATQSERGLFLHLYEQGDKLYVSYAEAPWTTFEKYEPFFRSFLK